MYVATINVPGYLPMDDDPPVFESIKAAWEWLAQERQREEDAAEMPGDSYSGTVLALEAMANATMADGTPYQRRGTVYGSTPGYDGNHDLGLAYSVTEVDHE